MNDKRPARLSAEREPGIRYAPRRGAAGIVTQERTMPKYPGAFFQTLTEAVTDFCTYCERFNVAQDNQPALWNTQGYYFYSISDVMFSRYTNKPGVRLICRLFR